jgi:hypothetical protein
MQSNKVFTGIELVDKKIPRSRTDIDGLDRKWRSVQRSKKVLKDGIFDDLDDDRTWKDVVAYTEKSIHRVRFSDAQLVIAPDRSDYREQVAARQLRFLDSCSYCETEDEMDEKKKKVYTEEQYIKAATIIQKLWRGQRAYRMFKLFKGQKYKNLINWVFKF